MQKLSFQTLNKMADALSEGKYAVIGKDGETPYFFEIAKVGLGHRIFRLEGSPGDYKRCTLNVAWQTHALQLITALPLESLALYGKLSRWCGICNSPLTNKASLDRGIGPVCYGKITKGQ